MLLENWRVVVLGTGGVGKSALLTQFAMNSFTDTYDPTIEDAFRKLLVVDNRICFVEAIDTAGVEEFASLRDQSIREGQGSILVYSVGSRYSFEQLESFCQCVRRIKGGNLNSILMVVGTKCDKTHEREVSKADGAALARQYGCDFIETSAKTTQNVERLFINVVRSLRKTSDTKSKQEPRQSAKKERKPCDCVIV